MDTYIETFGFLSAEIDNWDQSERYDIPYLGRSFSSVPGFLSWCSSNCVIFNPVCFVNWITVNAILTHSVMRKLYSKNSYNLVLHSLYRAFACSRTCMYIRCAVFNYHISRFAKVDVLCGMKRFAIVQSDLIRYSVQIKNLWQELVTSFVSDVLHILQSSIC